MQVDRAAAISAGTQIRRAVSASLGCEPRRAADAWRWGPRTEPGIRSAVLRPQADDLLELDVVLALVAAPAAMPLCKLWEWVAALVKDLTVIPIEPTRNGADEPWQIMVRIKMREAAMDLPRLGRLHQALDLIDRTARAIQAELPLDSGHVVEVPPHLRELLEPLVARMKVGSEVGDVCRRLAGRLRAGLSVAIAGSPLRIGLELQRLAGMLPNLARVRQRVLIEKLPQLGRTARSAGLIPVVHCDLLRPRMSVYEQGRELEAALEELHACGLPVLTFGKREQLEAVFGVGQGRDYSPLQPVIETLPTAEAADLVRAAFAESGSGLARVTQEQRLAMVLETLTRCAPGKEDLLHPLSNLAVSWAADDPGLPAELERLARDLAGCRDTFGTCGTAPATPRPQDLAHRLRRRLAGRELRDRLASRLLGQEAALDELTARLWREARCRPDTEPLRVMLAGPVGTGKSVAGKIISDWLGLEYQYIDATAFDSEHAVKTALAGASPGIVGSYDDGILSRISRQHSLVEVADMDHARPTVRAELCNLFLRILQEGTLQTGSGRIVRTLPSCLFVFTSNVAYGTHKASTQIGFGTLTREEVRQRVVSRALEHLGHAFVSRVGEPILFDEFTRQTAFEVAARELQMTTARAAGAARVRVSPEAAALVANAVPTLETGARGILYAAQEAVALALRDRADMTDEHVTVEVREGRIVIEPETPQPEPTAAPG